jgi:predicted ATPase/DNA-binding SARP family transcriptional activator
VARAVLDGEERYAEEIRRASLRPDEAGVAGAVWEGVRWPLAPPARRECDCREGAFGSKGWPGVAVRSSVVAVEFRILGPLEVCGESGAVALGGIKPRAVLALLLLHANQPVQAERLALAVWGQDAPASAVKTVQVCVSRLRKALDDAEILATTPAGYCLRVRPDELDAERFARLVEGGRRALEAGQAGQAVAILREALALWRGPALAELAFEPFAQAEIARLEEQRLSAIGTRVDCELQLGQHGAVIGELQQLVAAHPGRECLAEQLMLALYRCGRQGDALEVYARTRAYLSGELGLEPGPTLRALQRRILEQAPLLDLQAAVTAPASSAQDSQRPFPLPAAVAAESHEMFVGRTADLEALRGVYAQVVGGSRRLVLLCGEPGIGKTRLAAQFARRAHDDGAIVLHGRCDEEALLAQQPFVEALRHYVCACPPWELADRLQVISGELRRIVPELADRIPDLPEPLAGDPDGARSRLFEAVGSLLCKAAQNTPVVLVLDDLHWADKATLLLLKYVTRYPRQARLMVLGTYRETELDVDHPLCATLAELGRERLLERRALTPLDAAAVSELVGIYTRDEASPQLRQIVYERSEGNAFFVVEILRHLAESGAITTTSAEPKPSVSPMRLAVPEGVKDVIAHRVARLGPATNDLLLAASALGHTFELDVLQRLSELDDDGILDGLDSAMRARIVEEVAGAAGRYIFSHALIRDSVYGGLTATRRALLHRRAGTALEQVHAAELEPYLAELAYHFGEAGFSGDLDKAIEYGTRAGKHAISQLAYEQAAAHFRQAIALIDATDPDQRQLQRCDLVIAQGEAERQAGDRAYRQTLLDGARLAQDLHDPDRLARAALANNCGFFSSAQGVDRERVAVLQTALSSYDSTDSPARAALLALLALELGSDEDWRLRDKLSDEAIAMARRSGDLQTLARVLTQSCLAKLRQQMGPELHANLREASQLADRLNDPLLAGHAAYLGAQVAMQAGNLEQADHSLARLTTVAEQLGQPFLRWYAVIAQAKRCAISGPADEAERLALAALQIGRQAGQPDSTQLFLMQLFMTRFLQGSLDRGDPHLPDLAGAPPPTGGPEITPSRTMPHIFNAAVSACLCEVGRLADARPHFELIISKLDELPHDYTVLAVPAHASITCARLGDKRSAKRLYAILEPHSHRFVTTLSSWWGPTTHYLALLAATLNRPDEADAHFAAAERTYTSLDANPWLMRLQSDRDAMLPARHLPYPHRTR